MGERLDGFHTGESIIEKKGSKNDNNNKEERRKVEVSNQEDHFSSQKRTLFAANSFRSCKKTLAGVNGVWIHAGNFSLNTGMLLACQIRKSGVRALKIENI